jgi:hypothetical protein
MPIMDPHVGELLVQTLKDIENESVITDDLTKITESVSHPLHLAAVVVDGEVHATPSWKTGNVASEGTWLVRA